MRFITVILFAASVLTGLCGELSSTPTDSLVCDTAAAVPSIAFPDGVTLDLGKIRPGKRYHGELRIANTGTAPLIIKRIFTDCGCTAASYPREPLMPRDTAVIKISYDSSQRGIGLFSRVLRIEANTPQRRHVIFLNGTVKR